MGVLESCKDFDKHVFHEFSMASYNTRKLVSSWAFGDRIPLLTMEGKDAFVEIRSVTRIPSSTFAPSCPTAFTLIASMAFTFISVS